MELSCTEPVRPMWNFFVGIAVPTTLICGFTLGAVLISLFAGSAEDGSAVLKAAYLGALIGALASFYGITDIAIAYFLSRGEALNRHFRTAGYLTVWLSVVAVVLNWRY